MKETPATKHIEAEIARLDKKIQRLYAIRKDFETALKLLQSQPKEAYEDD